MKTQQKFDFDKVMESFKPFDDLLNTYFNTTNVKGTELKQHQLKAGSQNTIILRWFQLHPHRNFTPAEVWKEFNYCDWPIWSVRRSITTLTKLGYLEKTKNKRPGLYPDLNFAWRLK